MPKPILHTALFHLPHHLSSVLVHADGNIHVAGAQHGGRLFVYIHGRYQAFRYWLAGISFRVKMLVLLSALAIPMGVLLTLFMLPKQVSYAYSGTNCFSNVVLLPGFVRAHSTEGYAVNMDPTLALGGYPLFSNKTCVSLKERPDGESSHMVYLQVGFIKKTISVASGNLPSLTPISDLSEPLSPQDGISFKLSQADDTFSYSIRSGDDTYDCDKSDLNVSCTLTSFNLSQGQEHQITVLQYFGGSGVEIFSGSIRLRDPVVITSASIENEQIVYDNPERVSFTTNKPLKSVSNVTLIADNQELGISTEITEQGFDVIFDEPLPRQAELALAASELLAQDGAYLPQAYSLRFSTSGGPKVVGVNIGSYDVGANTPVVLTFDYAVATNQNISDYVKLRAGNEYIQTAISVSGNKITITKNLAACTTFSVEVVDGITNSAGITGGSAWSLQSRTTCRQTYSIGTSMQGRSIIAHRFGSGSTTILFVGGTHGDERSSYYTLNAWIDELEKNYGSIPAGKTVIVIPNLNPDGFAAYARLNANGIDLNRNFPSDNWTSGVYIPGNVYLEQGGGATPLSEPESIALALLVEQTNPRLVLTYHAVARAVIANGAGDSIALSALYGDASGFTHYDSGHEDILFNYATTGEFETWLADNKAIPTLLVELATLGSNELSTQRNAMWSMLSL